MKFLRRDHQEKQTKSDGHENNHSHYSLARLCGVTGVTILVTMDSLGIMVCFSQQKS